MKSKVRGMLYGVAVGDALGQPHEMGAPLGYPVSEFPATGGQTTDDWQMTRAMAIAMVGGSGFNMTEIVKEHVAAFNTTIRGWGGAHRDACAALKKGVSPTESGKCVLRDDKPYRGRGNGMCMKISPLAAYHFATKVNLFDRFDSVSQLTLMTHPTSIGLSSAIGMESALIYCLENTPATFNVDDFLASVHAATELAERCVSNESPNMGDKMSERIAELSKVWSSLTPEEVTDKYKGGGYAYESLPFSLAFFCMGNHDAACVYDCVGSGGDTDTNGSMVAAMAGALHGEEIFSRSLLYKLLAIADIDRVIEAFADWCERQR